MVQLMARLALEDPDGDASETDPAKWIARIGAAVADPGWHCGQCGAVAVHWQPLCTTCHGMGSIQWRLPARADAKTGVMTDTMTGTMTGTRTGAITNADANGGTNALIDSGPHGTTAATGRMVGAK
jgi:HemY protein